MSIALTLAIAAILGSLVMLAIVVRRNAPNMRSSVSAGMASLLLGFVVLLSSIRTPSSVVLYGTQSLLGAIAAWLMFVEWKAARRR